MQQQNEQTEVIFYTRQFCPLCNQARAILDEVCAEAGLSPVVVDIDEPPAGYDRDALQTKYSDYVPVVTVNGVQQGFWRLDPEHLRRAIGS